MWVLGIVLVIVAVILYLVSQSNKRRAMLLTITELTPIADLQSLHSSVAAEAGKGSFSQRVSVQGTIECAQPLISELSRTPCAAYRYAVERRWEESYEERQSDGTMQTRTNQSSDTLASNERRLAFTLHDASGEIPVAPDGANLELETTVDRFDPGDPGSQISFGNWSLPVTMLYGSRRTLGYHYHEETLPVGRTVYVLGTASDQGGTLTIGRSLESHEPFLISLHSREQMIASAKSTSKNTLYAAYASGALGVILFILGLITH